MITKPSRMECIYRPDLREVRGGERRRRIDWEGESRPIRVCLSRNRKGGECLKKFKTNKWNFKKIKQINIKSKLDNNRYGSTVRFKFLLSRNFRNRWRYINFYRLSLLCILLRFWSCFAVICAPFRFRLCSQCAWSVWSHSRHARVSPAFTFSRKPNFFWFPSRSGSLMLLSYVWLLGRSFLIDVSPFLNRL